MITKATETTIGDGICAALNGRSHTILSTPLLPTDVEW